MKLIQFNIKYFISKDKKAFTALNHPEVQALLLHWLSNDVKLSTARQKWLDLCEGKCRTEIGNFKQKVDRQALCAYFLTGELLLGEVGSVLMFSLPKGYSGAITLNESVFHAIEIHIIMKERLRYANIVVAAIETLRTGINRLKRNILDKSIIIDLHLEIVDISRPKILAEIAAFNPYTMSWSNVSDYCKPSDFHTMARQCSGKDTIHFGYSMNWPSRVFGVSVLDYAAHKKEDAEFLDKIIEASNDAISRLYDMLGCKNILLTPPTEDPRNLIDYMLCSNYTSCWIDYFFSQPISGIKNISRQVHVEKSFYNIFARANSTVYFEFNYDPESSLNGVPY